MVRGAGLLSAYLREEGVEGVVPSSNGLLTRSCLYSRLVFGGRILRHIWQQSIIIIINNFIVMHEEHLVRRHLAIRLDAMFKIIIKIIITTIVKIVIKSTLSEGI